MKAGLRLRCLYASLGCQVAGRKRIDQRAGKVMSFETARMRKESETLLCSELQLTQAMESIIAVVGVGQSLTAAMSSFWCWILR